MKKIYPLLVILMIMSSCVNTPPGLTGGSVKPKKETLYYHEFLNEGMAGKKDKSGYRYKKKPTPLESLISWFNS
jgi:hypothetical protein